jgi:2-polyprenyl-3-methyl-5-hydroxy-6-metoxy-1,4-benzoquinol methylase
MSEFDQKAADWDKNKMNLERTLVLAEQLKKVIPFKPELKVMEFGAGTGLLSFYLKDHFSEITLMDSSLEMLKMAEQKMNEADRLKIKTLFFNIETEEYSGKKFDIIYSQMVLHHLKETAIIFRKFYQMLNPGGILAIADLYEEDGSFHDFNQDVHKGFDPEKLASLLQQQKFHHTSSIPSFVIRKEVSPQIFKNFPLFLLTTNK